MLLVGGRRYAINDGDCTVAGKLGQHGGSHSVTLAPPMELAGALSTRKYRLTKATVQFRQVGRVRYAGGRDDVSILAAGVVTRLVDDQEHAGHPISTVGSKPRRVSRRSIKAMSFCG